MGTKPTSRRGFFGKASAALVAPLAATQAVAAEQAGSDLSARVRELEDVNAIRALQRTYARLVSAGARGELAALCAEPHAVYVEPAVRAIPGDGFDERDVSSSVGTERQRRACTARLKS
jgi:hypothetical protein